MKKSKQQIYLEIAKPDSKGHSRWVHVPDELPSELHFKNGCPWAQDNRGLGKTHKIEKRKERGRIVAMRTVGLRTKPWLEQGIRKDIWDEVRKHPCAFTGTTSQIEVDHKDGRKDDPRIMKLSTQVRSDMQPACKNSNDVKRQACVECVKTGIRFDAATKLGFPAAVVEGNLAYEGTCVGCFQYDPISFRSRLTVIR